MADVEIRNVEKLYGSVKAIKGVSLSIRDGELTILVGPSGCGKSTLLRMIAGLESVEAGEIGIDGRVVNKVKPKDRDIAMVFQNYALYPHMSVRQNMGFSLSLGRVNKAETNRRVEEAAAILGLTEYLERFPRQLSGGQRQRVAMGRAIVRSPKVFLFDEPLSNLDAKLRVQMRIEIKALHQKLGATMVYVTHDQIEAMTMADKIVVMRDGLIEQTGTPIELYEQPANTFVAQFIGSPSMNLLSGEIVDGSFRLDGGIALPVPANGTIGPCSYGIRPEHMRLDPAGVAAQVLAVEPTGPETHVHVQVGKQMLVCALRDHEPIQPGSVISILPDINRVHIFAADGMRVG
ncbi:ABC transporter ATP-binding protein [Devosia ginsengisoli]|uniref:ABC transporter ATP-binding protein n=1 Tax=Devosia ginsengisoli TaxID=400770 RepID=UPI0026E9E198|nr:sn-glycerol-3-phosphate ABC transporter ATP-binding protein UgpC [Devosia ginsengisoli]MCR6670142.1 sn-glycerol-3-phosphate ABC transporter ATP-binding protein UgpC [Devosia ginsengisoli]